ncbi:FUN14 family-domain-containing protein [Chiua virens]|nr:FUN14 family-domain-containing protein [Chiua virens]
MTSFILHTSFRPCVWQPATFFQSSVARAFAPSKRLGRVVHQASAPRIATLRRTQRSLPLLIITTGVAGAALGISSLKISSALHYAPPPSKALPSPPKSSVNVYELTFGTVCGLSAGVFVKKSAYLVAYFLGGLFVILQWLGSVDLVKVDWARMASRFENLCYTTDAVGHRKPPTVASIWKWIVDFLTADFQPRASFIAGFALGLRVG